MPLLVPLGCLTGYFLTSDGELPEVAMSWHMFALPSKQNYMKESTQEENKSCQSFVVLLLFIKLGW